MTDNAARTHTHISNRSKHRDNIERKVVFKSVLDNPFRIPWCSIFVNILFYLPLTCISRPNVQPNVQDLLLARLLSIMNGVSEYLGNRSRQNRRRKAHHVHERRKRQKVNDDSDALPVGMVVENATSGITAVRSNDHVEAEEPQREPPPILQHLIIGINEVTKRLEHQVKSTRRVVTVSESGMHVVTESRSPIKVVFVCRADVDPPLLIGHLPHLVAACNSSFHDQGPFSDLPCIKLVQLPKGAEFTLAESIGIRRVAVLAMDVSATLMRRLVD